MFSYFQCYFGVLEDVFACPVSRVLVNESIAFTKDVQGGLFCINSSKTVSIVAEAHFLPRSHKLQMVASSELSD